MRRLIEKWSRIGLLVTLMVAVPLGFQSCSEDEEESGPSIVGKWKWESSGEEELIEFKSNGHGVMVHSDIAASSCNYITFSYTTDEDSIYFTQNNYVGSVRYELSANGNQVGVYMDGDITTFARTIVAVDTTGCQEGFEGAYAPEYDTGVTDSNGALNITLANYTVHLNITLEGGLPAVGANVEVFQGAANSIVWIQLAGYYPIFQVLQLGQNNYNIILELIESGGFFQIIPVDPPHIVDLFADASVTAHCFEGTLSDIFEAGTTTIGDYMAIRIHGEAAALGGGGIVNLGMFTNGLNEAAFAELMFGATSIYAGDSLEYCLYSINVNGSVWYLPYLQIGDVISQQTFEYDYKFIVSWGANPSDLDSHLFTPEIDGQAYHVYYGYRGSDTAAPYAWLDVDDVTSWGPEAMTIEQLYPGTYTFAVYEFSGSGTLATSECHVEVFNGRTRVGGYDVPTTADGDNWWWTVGTVDGTTGTFTLVNTLAPQVVLPVTWAGWETEMIMPAK